MKRTFVLTNSEKIPQGVFTFELGEDITDKVILCINESYNCTTTLDKIVVFEFDYEIDFEVRVEFDEDDFSKELFTLIRTENY
jgi:hypothetical protein